MNNDFDVGPGQELDDWLTSQCAAMREDLDRVLDIEAGLHDALAPSLHRQVVADLDQILDVEAGLNAIVSPRNADLQASQRDAADDAGSVAERIEHLAARVVELETAERELWELGARVSRPVPAPDRAMALRISLTALRLAARNREDIRPVLESCERAVERALTKVHKLRRELDGQLGKRNELRGLLTRYKSMAETKGLVEDTELTALYRRAHEALWRAPCDVPAAEPLVADYVQDVRRKLGTAPTNTPATIHVRTQQAKTGAIPMHRTIMVVDVEGFGDPRRTNTHQLALRAGLYRVLQLAFKQAGVSWNALYREDLGDGVLILAPAQTPKSPFVEAVPKALVQALRTYNATHPAEEQIRLRMALHAGEVTSDQHGVTGAAVNLTLRLVNVVPMKAVLAESSSVLTLITSEWFFDEVVRQSPGSDADTYRPVPVTMKEAQTVAWISLPEHPRPASSTPLRDALVLGRPGVQEAYVVLPRSLIEEMPLPWQNAMVQILDEFHQAWAHLSWPEYRVVPSRRERLVNLDEEQLAEVGYLVEIEADGEVVYRDRWGKLIADPESTEVLVSFPDPIPHDRDNANQDTPPRGFPQPSTQRQTNVLSEGPAGLRTPRRPSA